MKPTSIVRRAFAALLLVSASGCAALSPGAHWVSARSVTNPAQSPRLPEDTAYAAAATAIDRGDYAKALDLLQLARSRDPDDIRVLNAFGVVYDKLGRFDLSARYYRQAKALDPTSPIVASNQAYSQTLQLAMASPPLSPKLTNSHAPVLVEARQSTPQLTASRWSTAVRPAVIRLGVPTAAAAMRPLPLLTGHTLVIIDASGRSGGAEPVRRVLAHLGWSTRGSVSAVARPQAQTTIRYAAINVRAARALARTLPAGARLQPCEAQCSGLRLIVGADARTWAHPRSASRAQRS
jgi:hypothetical protein